MIEINQDTPRYATLIVDRDDRLYGVGSKKYRVYAASSSANPVVKFQETWDYQTYTAYYDKSATIENLIIDGENRGVTGIKLENVVGCQIRNITIKNCNVGVEIGNLYGAWSELTRLVHIRMENVNKGILFTSNGPGPEGFPGDSAGFTVIDDVGIALANNDSAVGIQIGNDDGTYLIKPYSSRIKANVWMGSAGGTGLKIINGELKYGLINLAVQGPSNGIGVDLQEDPIKNKVIYYNQFSTFDGSDNVTKSGFLLATNGISYTPPNDRRILPNNAITDILKKSW